MRYIWQHIQAITEKYKGDVPLSHFLKQHFKQNPKLGSRDRKILSEMAYAWYRCEKGISSKLSIEEKIKICLILSGSNAKHILPFLPEAWQNMPEIAVADRIKILEQDGIAFKLDDIAPQPVTLSDGISHHAWLSSILKQPRLFIRIRKEKDKIIQLLKEHDTDIEFISDTCLSLPNGSAVDKILPAEWYVVQDASSQKTGDYFHARKNEQWYDCCAGAGGKSLLLVDAEPGVKLTVSDKRDSILHNLKQRFKLYQHTVPKAYVCDTANKAELQKTLGKQQFDNIICDAPCSGSGTWARTPEQLYFFQADIVQQFSQLQQRIAINTLPYLKNGGRFIYITCSIFKAENEHVAHNIIAHTGAELEEMKLINGTPMMADDMFIAVLRKN